MATAVIKMATGMKISLALTRMLRHMSLRSSILEGASERDVTEQAVPALQVQQPSIMSLMQVIAIANHYAAESCATWRQH